jgi:hypothetical protein
MRNTSPPVRPHECTGMYDIGTLQELPHTRCDPVVTLLVVFYDPRLHTNMGILLPPHPRGAWSGSLLAAAWEYSHHLAFYWPPLENIPTIWHSIGRSYRIFPQSGILLAAAREYSHNLAFYWPQLQNIPTIWHSIGRSYRIFPQSGILLAAAREYSHNLAFYWPQLENIPTIWHSIGRS